MILNPHDLPQTRLDGNLGQKIRRKYFTLATFIEKQILTVLDPKKIISALGICFSS